MKALWIESGTEPSGEGPACELASALSEERAGVDVARGWMAALDALSVGAHRCFVVEHPVLREHGVAVVSTLRHLEPAAPLLVYAPNGDVDEKTALEWGVDGVIEAWADLSELLDHLDGMVRQRRHHLAGKATERRVLVVDDDQSALLSLARSLRRDGFDVCTAQDGVTALRLLREHAVGALITDLMMPLMSGDELVAAALRFDPDVAAVVMTGYPCLPAAQRSLAAGATDFLLKPVGAQQIWSVARKAWTRAMLAEVSRACAESEDKAGQADIRVLSVEDAANGPGRIATLVQEAGQDAVEVTAVDRLSDAFDLIERQRFDILLVDLEVPRPTGLETLVGLRHVASQAPVLAVVSGSEPGRAGEAHQLGADECIVWEGLTAPELMQRIRHAVGNSRTLAAVERYATKTQEENEKLRSVVEGHGDALLVVDGTDRVVYVNPSAQRLFGRGASGLVGAPFPAPLEPGRVRKARIATKGGALTAEVRVFPSQWQGRPARLACLREVTGEATASAVQVGADQRSLELGQISAGVAHEINNPTAFMLANLCVAREHVQALEAMIVGVREQIAALPEGDRREALAALLAEHDVDYVLSDLREVVADNIQGVDRITLIVKELRRFGQLRNVEVERVDVNELIDQALAFSRSGPQSEQIGVEAVLGELPPLAADREKLLQALTGLIANACEAIVLKPATERRIHVTSECVGDVIEVRVSDSGVGIAPDLLQRIFQPFYSTKAKGDGSGLGLSLSRAFVARHEGTITVESEVGQGSTFTVRLPIQNGLGQASAQSSAAPRADTRASEKTTQEWPELIVLS